MVYICGLTFEQVAVEHFTSPKTPYLVIVEDDEDDQELISEIISSMTNQFSIQMLSDGDQVFDLLDQISEPDNLPVLIVLDDNLPRLGGEATLMMLRHHIRYRTIPVALYSASMTPEKEADWLRLGASSCHKKPSSLEGIHCLLSELVRIAQSLQHQNSKASGF